MSILNRTYRAPVSAPPPTPPYLQAGRRVHYYPLTNNPAWSAKGGLFTITAVGDRDHVRLSVGGQTVTAVRGGTNGTLPGSAGTFDALDTRHRSRVRIHLPHATALATNIEATPALRDRYWLNGDLLMEIDIIMTSPATQQAEFASTTARLSALGFDVSYGLLTVAGFTDASDPTLGIESIYLNKAHWQLQADRLAEYEALGANHLGDWIHCQMEAAPAPVTNCYLTTLESFGHTREEVIEAMAPYTNAIRATKKRVIVRPFGVPEDVALLEVLRAGAWGSLYCYEGDGFAGKHHRRSQYEFEQSLGNSRAVWGAAAEYMPPGVFPAQFHYEQGLRMFGQSLRQDYLAEGGRYPIYELTYINEVNGAVNNPHIGKDIWFQCISMNRFNANLGIGDPANGPLVPSANDVHCSWFVYNDTASVQVEQLRNHGLARGTPNGTPDQGWVGLFPWKRTTSTDAIENTRAWGSLGLTTPALVTNEAHGWYIAAGAITDVATGQAYTSFGLAFDMILPSVAPANGVTWGICGQAQTNAHSWCLVWNGTTGNIELRVRDATGQDTFTYIASPTPGSQIPFVITYDRAQGTTGKWWTPAGGWVTPDIVKNTGGLAILIGGTHDLLNRTTTVWGIPGAVIPYGTYVQLWKRALIDAEITCRRDPAVNYKFPYGYGTFF